MSRRERMLTQAEVDTVLASCKAHWKDYLTVLHLTGMRPFSEAARLTAEDLDRDRKRAVLVKHKTSEKTGKPRVIYFAPAAWEIIERYAEKRPTGVLFRNGVGKKLCSRCVNEYLKAACERAKVVPFPVYSLRHFRLSSALALGAPIEVLAQLSGNSPAVLRSNYKHLGDDVMADVLTKAAEKAVS
jgi:integrase